jgi:hypothetical protein
MCIHISLPGNGDGKYVTAAMNTYAMLEEFSMLSV